MEKLHNYTKAKDYAELNGAGKQILDIDISRANNNHIVTAGENNSVNNCLSFSSYNINLGNCI